jgi:hypothetical protein
VLRATISTNAEVETDDEAGPGLAVEQEFRATLAPYLDLNVITGLRHDRSPPAVRT